MQQTYEIYHADICSCASDWVYLGKVQAVSQDEALDEAARCWPEEERAEMVTQLMDEGVHVHLIGAL